jgi:hypothetical protein
MAEFSDYIVYVDESGDHGLKTIDPQFPVFALSFCVVSKTDYSQSVVPAVQDFKFKYWGHDMVVLHENEIRKEKGDFAFLMTDKALREGFLADLTEIMDAAPMRIIASVIDKVKLKARYPNPWNPYEIAMHFCLERLFDFLIDTGQEGKTVHVVFECRGEEEDRELELEFRRICDQNQQWGYQRRNFTRINFVPRFAKKSVNSTGLQLADLTARPIALRTLRPEQPNRAYETIEPKLAATKVFP